MIQRIANLLDQRFERNEIEHDSGMIDFAFKRDRNLVIVPV